MLSASAWAATVYTNDFQRPPGSSYPEWTGGWSTGPRLLVPLLPFAMIPVAAALANGNRWSRVTLAAGLVLALAGGMLRGALREAVVREIGAAIASVTYVADPLLGAVVLARRLLAAPPTAS